MPWNQGAKEPHAPRVATDPLCARGRGDERWELGRRLGCGLGSQALAEIRGGIPLGSELAQLDGVGSGLAGWTKLGPDRMPRMPALGGWSIASVYPMGTVPHKVCL